VSDALPPLDSLRCFVEAARSLSFRKAARTVHLSPAAVGQRIRALEDLIGGPLFSRTTRKMALTPRGLSLLPMARDALGAAERCLGAGEGAHASFAGDLVLGTRHELGMSWILPQLPSLGQEHPRLSLHLYVGSGADLVSRVATRDIDCAITSSRIQDPQLEAIKLAEETYDFVGATKLLAKKPLRKAEDARNHVLFDTTSELPLFRYFRDARGGIDSMRFGKVVRLGAIEAIRAMVEQGHGVAVLPTYYVAEALQKKRLTRVTPKVDLPSDWFRLVFRADDARRPLYDWLAARMQGAPLR
jgi:LysR family glycine cleavage system transcriptional activator